MKHWQQVLYLIKEYQYYGPSDISFTDKEIDLIIQGTLPDAYLHDSVFRFTPPPRTRASTDLVPKGSHTLGSKIGIKNHLVKTNEDELWYRKQRLPAWFQHKILTLVRQYLDSPDIINYLKNEEFNKFLTCSVVRNFTSIGEL